ALADVGARGRDVKGVPLVLQPGGSISGKLVFDSGGTAVPDLSMIRIGASIVGAASYYQQAGPRVGNALSEVSPVPLKADGTFELSGLGPSSYVLTCVLPNNLTPIWLLRSAIVDGRDLLDTAVTGPFVTASGVAATFVDKRTEITGSRLPASGQPASEYYVIAFSTDRVHWRVGSRRLVSARPATDG